MYNANSPLNDINISFSDYVRKRKTSESEHLIDGVPDYAFALDNELRANLMKIPHFYSICKTIMSSIVTQEIQRLNQQALAVGPNQFPEIYQMGAECAQKLGIGVPNIFILNEPGVINAYTIAADDTSPMVVLHSSMVERMTAGELKAVIAHECGHIHNNHSVLQPVVNYILNGLGSKFGIILSAANIALMRFWTRAGEITADRAALICADNLDDPINVDAIYLSGGIMGKDYTVNLEALRQQMEATFNNPSRLYEIQKDHPFSIRRIFADMEFEECEVFYKWRPELKRPDTIQRSKQETDERCKKLVNILGNK